MAKDDDPAEVGEERNSETDPNTPPKVSKQDEAELIESFSKPLQSLEEALEQQRQDERETFKQLMDENSRLKRALEKAEEREEEQQTKYEILKIDFEAEQAKNKAHDETIKAMENDMRALIVTKKSKGKGKKSKAAEHTEEISTLATKYENDDALPFSDKYTQQIKDLKFRLKRLAEDSEVKDRRIKDLETEVEDTLELMVEVQKHVDESKLDELRQKIEERKKDPGPSYYDKENVVVSTGDGPKSAVCVIQ